MSVEKTLQIWALVLGLVTLLCFGLGGYYSYLSAKSKKRLASIDPKMNSSGKHTDEYTKAQQENQKNLVVAVCLFIVPLLVDGIVVGGVVTMM
jgi:hypothetical protein